MATISILPDRASVYDLEEHYHYTSIRLSEDPPTKPRPDPTKSPGLAARLQVIEPRIEAAVAEDKALKLRLLRATLRAEYADKELDLVTAEAAKACDMRPASHKDLFGEQRASDFRRPVLSDQLDRMMLWPEKLDQSPVEALRALIPRVKAAVAAGVAAQAELRAASDALELFRSGTLSTLIQDFNALRLHIFGELGTIQQQHGNAQALGSFWPNSFFRPTRARKRMTMRELEARIATLEARLIQLQKRRQVLLDKAGAVAQARAEAQRQAIQAQLEASRKAMEAMSAKSQELQAALEQLQNRPEQPGPDIPVDDILDDDGDDEPPMDDIDDILDDDDATSGAAQG